LVKKYGKEAERVAYASAVNQVKKKAANKIEEPTTEEPMDQEQKLKEMIQAALSKPLSEKKKSSFTPKYDDEFTDKRKNLPDNLQKAILKRVNEYESGADLIADDPISEDLDLTEDPSEKIIFSVFAAI
jgi:hypothetical protein